MTLRAAIDIGSTSTNLLIRGPGDTRQWFGEVTRLADGDPEPTLTTLRRYRSMLDDRGITVARVVATAAARSHPDPGALVHALAEAVGRPVEILDAESEGRYSSLGALAGLGLLADGQTLVVDIGGGSTEFALGDKTLSLALGAAVLTTEEFANDPPRPEELTNALGRVADELDELVREHPQLAKAERVVGVAGTLVITAAVEIGALDPDLIHGFVLNRDAVEDVFRTLATEPLRDRVHNPGLPGDRAPLIVGGLCLLVAIMRKLQLGSVTVSMHGLLDGLVADLSTP